jgi:UDP-N-acetylmuramoyl-tripeptide--D-alanyl-D-alanine ligase
MAVYITTAACVYISGILTFIRLMHIFQLNGYSAKPQINWLEHNIPEVSARIAAILVPAIFYGLYHFKGSLILAVLTEITGIAAIVYSVANFIVLWKKAKKNIVVTARVIRMCVAAAIFYQIASEIYCAVTYTAWDRYIELIFMGVFTAFTIPFSSITANFINTPFEKHIGKRYIKQAKKIINSLPNLTTIGITGSYGKTSTKFFLNAILSVKYNVLMTPESYNTTMGVVKTVRERLSAVQEVFLCEMGAKKCGEIKEICDIVKPKHSMITSIGEQHLESFKTVENIVKTKFEIADCITDGTVFLNYDNPYIRKQECNKNKVTYGFAADTDCSCKINSVTENGTSFTVTYKGEVQDFETRLIGANNVQNIAGAIAVAGFLGMKLSEMVLPVKRLEAVPHRMQLTGGGNRIIIDDAFNSNPAGAKAALETLDLIGKADDLKIVITPGMVELGDKETELNKELGKNAAEKCDYALLVGEKRTVPIKSGLLEAGFNADKVKTFRSLQEALEFADSLTVKGKKIILLENDLPDNYN